MSEQYVLPSDEELLKIFPFEPSGEYIVNINDHGHPDVFYDEEAEREFHLQSITDYIQHIVDVKKVSLAVALDIARKEETSNPLYLQDPSTWDSAKVPWYIRDAEDNSHFEKEPDSCPGPCKKLTYTSPIIDMRQSNLPTPATIPNSTSFILVDENGLPFCEPGCAEAANPQNAPYVSTDTCESGKFGERYEVNNDAERDRLMSVAGVSSITQAKELSPDQKSTFDESWVQEEAKLFLDSSDIQTRKFWLQNRRVMLTYKTHINKDSLREFIRTRSSCPDAVVDIAHENGDPVCPYQHTHAVVDFGKKFQSQNCRVLDYDNIHPHILPIPNEQRYAKCRHYISKEDPDCSYLYNPNVASSFTARIWSCKTLQDALRQNVHNPSDVSGIMQLYSLKGSDVANVEYEQPTHPWQQQLLSIVTKPVTTPEEKRSIIWIYDDVGTAGKSQFCRYLFATSPDKWYIVTGIAATRDIATVVTSALSSGWTGHGFVFDIPRVESEKDLDGLNLFSTLMTSIEIIKNGIITSFKYQGHTRIFNQPWIVVMSNGLPNVRDVTINRWNIFEMLPDLSMKYVSAQEAYRRKQDIISTRVKSAANGDLPFAEGSYSTTSGLFPV